MADATASEWFEEPSGDIRSAIRAHLRPLPMLTAKDIPVGMTVCIAAMTGESIVAICDSMGTRVSGGKAQTYDAVMTKYGWIAPAWRAAFTGNNVSHLSPIWARMRDELNPKGHKGPHDFLHVGDVAKKIYHEYWEQRINDEFFSRFNTNLREFTADPSRFTDAQRQQIFRRVSAFNIPLTVLLYGWDNRGAHIMTVESPGVINHFDFCGFWAVGATASVAIDYLSRCRIGGGLSSPQVMVRVFESKFKAENPSLGVGPGSDAWMVYWDAIDNDANRSLFIAHDDIDAIKTCCKAEAFETTGQIFDKATDIATLAIKQAVTQGQIDKAILGVHLKAQQQTGG